MVDTDNGGLSRFSAIIEHASNMYQPQLEAGTRPVNSMCASELVYRDHRSAAFSQ